MFFKKILSFFVFNSILLSPALIHAHGSHNNQDSSYTANETAARLQFFYRLYLEEYEKALVTQPRSIVGARSGNFPLPMLSAPSGPSKKSPPEVFIQLSTYSILFKSWDFEIEINQKQILQNALKRYHAELDQMEKFPIDLREPGEIDTVLGKQIVSRLLKLMLFVVPSAEFLSESAAETVKKGLAFGMTFFAIEFAEHHLLPVTPGSGPICMISVGLAGVLSFWAAPFKFISWNNPHPMSWWEVLRNAATLPFQDFHIRWSERKAKFAAVGEAVQRSKQAERGDLDPVERLMINSPLFSEAWWTLFREKYQPTGCSGNCASCCRSEKSDAKNPFQNIFDRLERGEKLDLGEVRAFINHLSIPTQILRSMINVTFDEQIPSEAERFNSTWKNYSALGFQKALDELEYSPEYVLKGMLVLSKDRKERLIKGWQRIRLNIQISRYERTLSKLETTLQILSRQGSKDFGLQHADALRHIVSNFESFYSSLRMTEDGKIESDEAAFQKIKTQIGNFRTGKHLCTAILQFSALLKKMSPATVAAAVPVVAAVQKP